MTGLYSLSLFLYTLLVFTNDYKEYIINAVNYNWRIYENIGYRYFMR